MAGGRSRSRGAVRGEQQVAVLKPFHLCRNLRTVQRRQASMGSAASTIPPRMSELEALVLGVVHGLTEFLPISSSGHLILVPWLLCWNAHSLGFDAARHLGTVMALIAYFWRDWLELLRAVLSGRRHAEARHDPRWRLAWLLVLGSIPAGLIGLALESTIERLVRQPWLIAILMIVFGLVLLVADRLGARERGIEKIRLSDALIVGLAQVLALAPGVSRSGITI